MIVLRGNWQGKVFVSTHSPVLPTHLILFSSLGWDCSLILLDSAANRTDQVTRESVDLLYLIKQPLPNDCLVFF